MEGSPGDVRNPPGALHKSRKTQGNNLRPRKERGSGISKALRKIGGKPTWERKLDQQLKRILFKHRPADLGEMVVPWGILDCCQSCSGKAKK